MRRLSKAAFAVLLTLGGLPAAAQQQRPAEPSRAPAAFDVAAIRRQAAQLAEFRALLSDPDSTVRLLVMREAIRAGDATQRQMAIEVGLASTESAMLDMALRGVLATTQQIVMEFVDGEGKTLTGAEAGGFMLTPGRFDQESGRLEGTSSCRYGGGKWTGQFQGTIFAFNTDGNQCSATLNWTAETGVFSGRMNFNYPGGGFRNVTWRPR